MFYALVFAAMSISATLWYPPIGICLYLLLYDFVSTNECFAFLNFGSNIIPLALVMICYTASAYRIILWYRYGRLPRWLLIAACASIFCGIYPIYSMIATKMPFSEVRDFITYIVEAGPVLVLAVLAYGREKRARYIFAGTILIQMILAFFILNFPVGYLAELNAANYHHYAPIAGGIDKAGNILRAVGQFSTTIQLGAYATLCLGIGIYLYRISQSAATKLLSSLFLSLGLWGEYLSFTRGILFSLVFTMVLCSFSRKGWQTVVLSAGIAVSVFWAGQALLESINSTATGAIAGHLKEMANPEDDSIQYRITGLKNALNIITEEPSFGLCSAHDIIDRGEICHFYPGWMAAMYGLPAGLAVLILFLCAVRTDLLYMPKSSGRTKQNSKVSKDGLLSSLLGWTAVCLLSTNFMGGRALVWIMLGFACSISAGPLAPPKRGARSIAKRLPTTKETSEVG